MTSLTDEAPEFVDLPADGRYRRDGKWKDRLTPLRDRPGEWARWKERGNTKSSGHLKRMARAGDFAPGIWEFTTRTVDGDSYLYARYTPEDGS